MDEAMTAAACDDGADCGAEPVLVDVFLEEPYALAEVFFFTEDDLVEVFLFAEDDLVEVFLFPEDERAGVLFFTEDDLVEAGFALLERLEDVVEARLYDAGLDACLPPCRVRAEPDGRLADDAAVLGREEADRLVLFVLLRDEEVDDADERLVEELRFVFVPRLLVEVPTVFAIALLSVHFWSV